MINEAGITVVSYKRLHDAVVYDNIVFWDAGFIKGHFSKTGVELKIIHMCSRVCTSSRVGCILDNMKT